MAMADTTGQQLSDKQASVLQSLFDQTRMELFKFEAGVAELVSFLTTNALATVIITNGNDVIQRDKLLACRATELFPHVLIGGGVTLACPATALPLVVTIPSTEQLVDTWQGHAQKSSNCCQPHHYRGNSILGNLFLNKVPRC